MKNFFLFLMLLPFLLISCKDKTEAEKNIDTRVPVTITTIDTTGLESYIDLNATATYLVKNVIKANATGYLNSVNIAVNDAVSKGEELFSIKTREAKVLGNTINKIDPTLNFGSAIKVRSNTNGIITSVTVQQGDYVQDGDALVTINDTKSFALVLSLPYDLKKYVTVGKVFTVLLPDATTRQATVQKFMPTVDAASQTQNVVLKISGQQDLPENLIVKVRITKSANVKTISLPKAAVLSDETETDFWIMKLENDTTAVKIPIKKGITTDDKVEILSPVLSPKDRILLTGNYGVADTITVRMVKNE
ncbi:efflux RND transporter periplasmic adaptor subunit [Flavobacterium sp.]|uniref:efflux RND transporter periplasmic adaptor subunit n=1 Tax=Flavobacterium sp. TaxID=239 RepID=UPI002FD8E2E9